MDYFYITEILVFFFGETGPSSRFSTLQHLNDSGCSLLLFTIWPFNKAEGVSVPTCRHDFNQAATRKPSAKKASWNSLTFSKTGLGIVISKDKARLNLNRGCFF